MTSAVEQASIGCFEPAHDASQLGVCPSRISEKPSPNSKAPDSYTIKPHQERPKKDAIAFGLGSQSEDAMAASHWTNLNPVQGVFTEGAARVEMRLDPVPSTPTHPLSLQKPQGYETPESSHSLPFLSLGISSPKRQRNRSSQVHSMAGVPICQQVYLQQLSTTSVQFETSTKNHNRIQLEVQKVGPELHKEGFLTLSLPMHAKQMPVSQKADPALSLTSQQAYSRQLTQPKAGLQIASSLHDCIPARTDLSSIPGYSEFACELRAAASRQLSQSAKFLTLSSSVSSEETVICLSQEASFPTSKDASKFLSEESPPCTANGTCKTSCLPVKQDMPLVSRMPVECVKDMHLLPCVAGFGAKVKQTENDKDGCVEHHDSGKSVKRYRSGLASGNGQKQCGHNVLEDCQLESRKAKRPTRKKRQAAEQMKASGCVGEATEANIKQHGDHLHEFTWGQKGVLEDYQHKKLKIDARSSGTEKHGEHARISHEECVASQTSPLQRTKNGWTFVSSSSTAKLTNSSTAPDAAKYSAGVTSEVMEVVNVRSVGVKFSATSAFTQMPENLSTVSEGQPSLPLSLELTKKLPDIDGKTHNDVHSSTDVDWGKFLALSATPLGHIAYPDSDIMLPFQHRFKQLQTFLKNQDESDQKECLQALRQLSAAARSSHALQLETRAFQLVVEEGKELKRMRLLNVLGKMPGRNLNDEGFTPHGPKLPEH